MIYSDIFIRPFFIFIAPGREELSRASCSSSPGRVVHPLQIKAHYMSEMEITYREGGEEKRGDSSKVP